jgi:hypothetical protein
MNLFKRIVFVLFGVLFVSCSSTHIERGYTSSKKMNSCSQNQVEQFLELSSKVLIQNEFSLHSKYYEKVNDIFVSIFKFPKEQNGGGAWDYDKRILSLEFHKKNCQLKMMDIGQCSTKEEKNCQKSSNQFTKGIISLIENEYKVVFKEEINLENTYR